jgi:hypothetical protein
MLGHYTFTLPEPLLRGEHRPLYELELKFGEDLESMEASPVTRRRIRHTGVTNMSVHHDKELEPAILVMAAVFGAALLAAVIWTARGVFS